MFEDKILKMNEDTDSIFGTYEKRTYTVEEIQNILGIGRNVWQPKQWKNAYS